MRQQAFALIFTLGILGVSTHTTLADDKISRNERQLPTISQQFLQHHFPNEKISYVIVDKDLFRTTYEVMLTNGKELEFYKDGEWKEIDAKKVAVPESILPTNISKYIKQNFPNDVFVVQIKKKTSGIEIELSNKLEIEFTSNGKFIRYDD